MSHIILFSGKYIPVYIQSVSVTFNKRIKFWAVHQLNFFIIIIFNKNVLQQKYIFFFYLEIQIYYFMHKK
jgi:hypothetical protein